ncbi:hypothetical protein UP06_15220 [Bradyrhizobium sp. LTSP857]|nr:hypothetical protein UP06_15220 [Bradyrhizobium sp. LTSP857]
MPPTCIPPPPKCPPPPKPPPPCPPPPKPPPPWPPPPPRARTGEATANVAAMAAATMPVRSLLFIRRSSLSRRQSRRSRGPDEENAPSPSTYKCARF